MNRNRKILLGLLLLNGVSAVGGGVALMTGAIPEQASWVEHTDFASLYLQVLYFIAGAAVVWCTPSEKPVSQ